MSFRKVFVAVDASPQSVVVFEQALELAKKDAASLMVFHCVELGAKLTYRSQIEEKTNQGEELLQEYRQKLKDQEISVQFSHRVGQPGAAICDASRSWGADLIVLGRRGHRGLTEVLLGSVSSDVVRSASCSVLIIQNQAANS